MKKKLILACAMGLFAVSQVYAQGGISVSSDYEGPPHIIGKTIIQSVQACGPVTIEAAQVNASSGSVGKYYNYTASSGTTWNKLLNIKGGYDCNRTNLKINLRKEREEKRYPNGIKYNGQTLYYVIYVTYYYTLSTGSGSHYSSSSSNSSSSSSPSSSSPERSSSYGGNSDSRAAELGAAMGQAAMEMQRAERIYNNYHAGGFSLAATISAAWGENLDLRFRYGSSKLGGDITCMIGHDWIQDNPGVLWNVGIGMYFGGKPSNIYLWDVDLGVKLGHCSNPNPKSFTAMIDLSTTHLIGPKHIIGLTAGVGIGLDGVKKANFVWDARGGIVIYFLQWDWF